jgi:hypothetical protein
LNKWDAWVTVPFARTAAATMAASVSIESLLWALEPGWWLHSHANRMILKQSFFGGVHSFGSFLSRGCYDKEMAS